MHSAQTISPDGGEKEQPSERSFPSAVCSGLRVEGLEFRNEGFGLRVWVLGFRVWGFGFRVWGSGFRVQGLGLRV